MGGWSGQPPTGALNRPRLVLVHGTRFDARQWRRYAERLPDAEVIAVDLPGSGTRVGQPFTMQDAVAVLADAVDTGGVPVVLAGHSLGGYVAASYAHANPNRLAALVLMGATADPSRHPLLRLAYTAFARALGWVGAERMSRGMNRVLVHLGAHADDLPDASGYAALPAAWASVIETASVDQVRNLACPVTIVNGQFDQLRVDASLYAAASGGRAVVVQGASHLFPVTHRAAVQHVLGEVLAAARTVPKRMS